MTCSRPGCDFPAFMDDLCDAHYLRKLRGESMDDPAEKSDRAAEPGAWQELEPDFKDSSGICSEVDCQRSHRVAGLCNAHYMRRYRDSSKTGPIKAKPDGPRFCQDPYCDGEHVARGLCAMHYMREYRKEKEAAAG